MGTQLDLEAPLRGPFQQNPATLSSQRFVSIVWTSNFDDFLVEASPSFSITWPNYFSLPLKVLHMQPRQTKPSLCSPRVDLGNFILAVFTLWTLVVFRLIIKVFPFHSEGVPQLHPASPASVQSQTWPFN